MSFWVFLFHKFPPLYMISTFLCNCHHLSTLHDLSFLSSTLHLILLCPTSLSRPVLHLTSPLTSHIQWNLSVPSSLSSLCMSSKFRAYVAVQFIHTHHTIFPSIRERNLWLPTSKRSELAPAYLYFRNYTFCTTTINAN